MLVGRCYLAMTCVDKERKTPMDYAYEGKHQSIIDFDKKMTVTLYAHTSRNLNTPQ